VQDLPDKTALLGAVAEFLGRDVVPATTDRDLAFRVRIAAHLLGVVLAELRAEDRHDEAEVARISEALGVPAEPLPGRKGERARLLRTLTEALATRIRDASLDPGEERSIRDAVVAGLTDKLAVVNPRFDTAPLLPGEEPSTRPPASGQGPKP
jgi:hypothetical protein